MDYKEDADRAVAICKAELKMREEVFKRNHLQKQKKVAEMDFIINLLRNYKKTLKGRTGNLFGS